MIRWFAAFVFCASTVAAQVTVDPERTQVRDGWWTLEVDLGLSDITPYRAFTLDAPRRLVIDFEDLSFEGVTPDTGVSGDRATAVRFGPLRPGWSRMVVDLVEPLVIVEAGMTRTDAGADLKIILEQASAEEFTQDAGAPPDPGWDATVTFDPQVAAEIAQSTDFVVVLDPGHGGIDSGADQGGIEEADLMLLLAQEARAKLNEVDGLRAVLTRDDDSFVPLSARLTIARQVGADLFISLHADALEVDEAIGASVYTLARDGGDDAARRIVERHERGDLLAGVDLHGSEDRVATALMDLARAQTGPEGRVFADMLVAELDRAGVLLNTRPRREGQFAVLTAADFPSVLVEVGFLSNAQDRARLASPQGRLQIVQALREAVTPEAR
jgi:N-acetylmuramoyl-L-alanine amidase